MNTTEFLEREIRRAEISLRHAQRKPHTPKEELRGLRDKIACREEALTAVQRRCLAEKPLTLEELRGMDGETVWVEDVRHWALIDIEKGGQWDGVPFAIWAENGMKFTYNIKNRGLHCYRRPPEGEEET